MKYSGTQALFQQKIWERYSNNFIMIREEVNNSKFKFILQAMTDRIP